MFIALQTGGPINEALVQIKDDASCNASHSGDIANSMICAASHSGFVGPCHVKSL